MPETPPARYHRGAGTISGPSSRISCGRSRTSSGPETIDAVSVTGGHLGAGLGVVELTVALHYLFDTPADRIVWDVGHQVYPAQRS